MDQRNHPAISVVVPLYNKRPYIRRCLESIARQSFAGFEVIVVDDGSTDDSANWAAMFSDARFRTVRQRNAGPAAARNHGVRLSTAAIVAFLDADDEWCPDFLSAMLSLVREHPAAGLFASGFRRCRAGEPDRETSLRMPPGRATLLFEDYLAKVVEGDFITSSSVAVRRDVFDSVGYFREGEHIGEDVEFWARIALHVPFAYDARILAIYHSEALDRSFARNSSRPPYPPIVSSLRKWLASEGVTDPRRNIVQRLIDYRLMNYAHWLLTLGRRADLLLLLAGEPWATPRFATEAGLLRWGLVLLPTRVIFTLRWRPGRIMAFFRRPARSRWKGDFVLNRFVSTCEGSVPENETLVAARR